MMTLELDEDQRLAVDAPFDRCVAILGEAGSGKTYALEHRIARARQTLAHCRPLIADAQRRLDVIAFEVLEAAGTPVRRIDDVDAAIIFEGACSPLFALEWDEFARSSLDPEVPGLRSPERFAESAFRLIRKLRDARIAPGEFLSRALTGATEFYAKPPNFANPALLAATKGAYHDSLDVTPQELGRQHRREVDLAKILAKLYEGYVELVRSNGLMTGRDAVWAAADLLRERPALATQLRETYGYAFVDDAEELTTAELYFLASIFGDALDGVTLCGDPASAISSVRVVAPDAAFNAAATRVTLQGQHRPQARILLHRARSEREEASFVAEHVAGWIASGVPAERVAVLFRSVANVEAFEAALLDRNVPTVVEGDANVFADRRSLDALALQWNVYDPFRHDWLLRTLSNPAMGLSEASIAALCSEPPNPQTPLFVLDDEPAPTTRSSRWDPKRDLRLGWNVVRGEQDDALSPVARERLTRFRSQRQQWLELARSSSFETFARAVWRDGLARDGPPNSARAAAQQILLERLLARLQTYLKERPDATLADVLAYAETRATTELESCEAEEGTRGFVRLASVEAARGREFDCVVIAGAAPGTFPRWYSPDAFLFSARLGMVPKENSGEGRASRTAKFSFYVHRTKAREGYNLHERRAFEYALRRARRSTIVTASGGVTRGTSAPEFLEELRSSRLPGIEAI